MATIALPRLALPRIALPRIGPVRLRAVLTHRYVALAGAALALAGTAAAVVALLPHGQSETGAVRIPLAQVLGHAPQGWRQSLSPAHGPLAVSRDVVRLSATPLAPPMAGETAPKPESAVPQGLAASGALTPAPVAGLFAPGPGGPLPIIAPDGRTPFEVYKRPFLSNGRPKVALVIGGLGLNARSTQAAIETLPGEITLSFVPYSEGLQGWIDMARAHGHEVLLETPMEPMDYPANDPGPYTLMTDAQAPDTVKKLEWILSRTTGYFGLTNYLGSRFLGSDKAYGAFATVLRGRGLGFIDDGAAGRRGGGVPRASAERVIDEQLSKAALAQQLAALESGALQRGQALGSGFAYPVTLETVATWSRSLDQRGLQLAPASALVTP